MPIIVRAICFSPLIFNDAFANGFQLMRNLKNPSFTISLPFLVPKINIIHLNMSYINSLVLKYKNYMKVQLN